MKKVNCVRCGHVTTAMDADDHPICFSCWIRRGHHVDCQCDACKNCEACSSEPPDEPEPDYGGVFDGNQVISDADPGL